MARKNVKAVDKRFEPEVRLAGGFGQLAAVQDAEALLRRSVLACLLWEDAFYEDGVSIVENIHNLIPQVSPDKVVSLAVEARQVQKLRHVPLWLAVGMVEHDTHKGKVANLLPQIILRPDELTEVVALYREGGSRPLAAQIKKGLRRACLNFDAYQIAKWNRKDKIKLRDVWRMVHPKPITPKQEETFGQLIKDTLPTPDTWEVALSSGKESKKDAWTRLITTRKLGALALLKNMDNIEKAGVDPAIIRQGLEQANPQWLLPIDFVRAADHAPRYLDEIEALMFRCLDKSVKLHGYTILVVDVSGSMNDGLISGKSKTYSRLAVAAMLAMLARETCERVSIYATAGNDSTRIHQTAMVKPYRGFALADAVRIAPRAVGGGGIFTRQCLEYIRGQEKEIPDRIIVFSDSQDCDYPHMRVPVPFGKKNYICDVSAHKHGVAYKGVWTAEISGWSENFLRYIAAYEGIALGDGQDVTDAEQAN